jgi:hypothetical protein
MKLSKVEEEQNFLMPLSSTLKHKISSLLNFLDNFCIPNGVHPDSQRRESANNRAGNELSLFAPPPFSFLQFPSSSFPVFCYGDFRFRHGFPVTLSAIVTVSVQSRVVKHCILNVFRLFSRYLAEISASREDRLAVIKVEEGSTTATASGCSFPSSWAGSWFLRKEISPHVNRFPPKIKFLTYSIF